MKKKKKRRRNERKKKKKVEELNEILKKQEEERKKFEPIIREAQERERKIQEEQRKIEEKAKQRNIEIERLNGRINDNLKTTRKMIMGGLTTSACSFGLGNLLFDFVGVSYSTGLGGALSSTLVGSIYAGLGSTGLAIIPLLLAGGYSLKKMMA